MREWIGGTVLVLGCLLPAGLTAQQTVEEPVFEVDAIKLELAGRVQMQLNTTTADDAEYSEMILRRVRFTAKVQVNDVISGKVQPDFAGDRLSLKDAYVEFNFAPALQLLAGKAYRPFSRLEQTSSIRMLPIERGVRIRGIEALDQYELINDLDYSDRDVGLQVMGAPEGAPLGFAYAAGIFAGPLQGRVAGEDPMQYAARVTLEPAPDLELGAGWSSRQFSRPAPGVPDLTELERGHAFEVDFEYGAFDPGIHVLGELTTGDFDPFTGEEFSGAQLWLGYRTGPIGARIPTLEPIFRASYGEVDRGVAAESLGGTLLTPGVNVYFGGWNRMMFNYDVWLPEGEGDAEGSFKAMFQLAF